MQTFFRLLIFVLAVSASLVIDAQSLPVPRNIERAYQKKTRSSDGKPGPAYWQNTAAYRLSVQFRPDTRLLTGIADIVYTNNSPDTLKQIWFKLYPNLYQSGTPRQSKIAPEDLGEGLVIDSMWVNDRLIDAGQRKADGTNLILGRQSLPHGQNLKFRILYHYTLNKGSHVRTGEVEPNADFIAYFFPRIAVYDDIDGWNRFPYNGSQEFYNDFCSFDVSVTVPKGFVVWGTGDLQNCGEVMKPRFCQRLQQAERSDTIVTVIDSTDRYADVTADQPFNTWHFRADHVTDFVFATTDHYIWKSASLVVDPATGRRTRVDAVFNKKHSDYFAVVSDARKTVSAMSYVFPRWPFPYAHETVFDGLDQMEYPMMVNDNPVEDRAESVELTDHEIFHTMFPFYMGINETKYAWMDEGWATIGEWIISPLIDSGIVDEYGVHPYELEASNEGDLPITTLSTQISGNTYFLNSYPKPAFGYLYVRDLLGDSLFTTALHQYIRQWQGMHPIPYDFFYSMNAGSGKNLNWFWQRWFFEGGFPDLAIRSVKHNSKGTEVVIASKGTKPVPIDLFITYANGRQEKLHRTVGVWEKGNSTVTLLLPGQVMVQELRLGSTYIPDVDKSDNVWKKQ